MSTVMKISSRNLSAIRRRSLVKGGMAGIFASGLAPGFARDNQNPRRLDVREFAHANRDVGQEVVDGAVEVEWSSGHRLGLQSMVTVRCGDRLLAHRRRGGVSAPGLGGQKRSARGGRASDAPPPSGRLPSRDFPLVLRRPTGALAFTGPALRAPGGPTPRAAQPGEDTSSSAIYRSGGHGLRPSR